MKESLFKIGDKVVIKVGVHKDQKGLIKSASYNTAWNVWQYNVNIVDPFDGEIDMVFAEEHLMPLEAEMRKPKATQIKDSGERTELYQEFIFDIPFTHIESMVFGNNALQIKCKTSKKELNGEEK